MACIMCLHIFDPGVSASLGPIGVNNEKWNSIISEILPQLSLDLSEQPAVCSTCEGKILQFKSFRETCIKNINRISVSNEDEDINKHLCQLCLKSLCDESGVEVDMTHSIFLKNLLPEMDSEFYDFLRICNGCSQLSEQLYQFQQTCLYTQNILQDHASNKRPLSHEELVEIAKDSKVNLDFKQHKSNLSVGSNDYEDLKNSGSDWPKGEQKMTGISYSGYSKVLCEANSNFDKIFLSNSSISEVIKQERDQYGDETSKDVLRHQGLDASLQFEETKVEPKYLELKMETTTQKSEIVSSNYESEMGLKCRGSEVGLKCLKSEVGLKSQESELGTQCEVELKTGMTKTDLNEKFYSISDDPLKRYSCIQCSYKSDRRSNLKQHFKYKHSVDCTIHKCTLCPFQAKHKSNFKVHWNKMHADNPEWYICFQCDFKSKQKACLVTHIKTFHVNRVWLTCDECSFRTPFKGRLNQHMKIQHQTHLLRACKECDFKTKYPFTLKQHVLRAHRKEDVIFKCEKCEYQTPYRRNLLTHIRVRHKTEEGVYKCEFCAHTTGQPRLLKRHVNLNHNTNAKIYTCPQCMHQTKSSYYLKHHMKLMHSEIAKTVKCELCDFATKTNDSLKRHVKAIHGENLKTFKCSYCDLVTKYSRYLKRHIKVIHEDDKLLSCEFCKFQTKHMGSLKSHTKNLHLSKGQKNGKDKGEGDSLKNEVEMGSCHGNVQCGGSKDDCVKEEIKEEVVIKME